MFVGHILLKICKVKSAAKAKQVCQGWAPQTPRPNLIAASRHSCSSVTSIIVTEKVCVVIGAVIGMFYFSLEHHCSHPSISTSMMVKPYTVKILKLSKIQFNLIKEKNEGSKDRQQIGRTIFITHYSVDRANILLLEKWTSWQVQSSLLQAHRQRW